MNFLDQTSWPILLVASGYFLLTVWFAAPHLKDRSRGDRQTAGPFFIALTVIIGLHLAVVLGNWFSSGPADVSWPRALSACTVIMALAHLAISLVRRDSLGAWLLVLPLAGLSLLVVGFGVVEPVPLETPGAETRIHVLASIAAFGVLGLAACLAVLLHVLDRRLRHHEAGGLLQALPPLTQLESHLFQLIGLGVLLLSASLLSGWLFVDQLFAQHLVHKTVLSIAAWVLFLVLLVGRYQFGWRGRTAVRLTLIATGLLILAYFGSKWVLEVLLNESWQI